MGENAKNLLLFIADQLLESSSDSDEEIMQEAVNFLKQKIKRRKVEDFMETADEADEYSDEEDIQFQESEKEMNSIKKEKKNLEERLHIQNKNKIQDKSQSKMVENLMEENRILDAQLDETLITFQAKESQVQSLDNDSRNQTEKLKGELEVGEEEQGLKLKQPVKEFQAQLYDKYEGSGAALEK